MFGTAALIQGSPVHKRRNALEHLPEMRPLGVRAAMNRAGSPADSSETKRAPDRLASQLDDARPAAAIVSAWTSRPANRSRRSIWPSASSAGT